MKRSILLLALLAGCPAPTDDTGSTDGGTPHDFESVVELASPSHATTRSADGTLYVAAESGIQAIADDGTATAVADGDRPPGVITFLHAPDDATLLARIHGKGLYRTTDNGSTWTLAETGLENVALAIINDGLVPIPMSATTDGGTTWLSTLGGVFSSSDGGQNWTLASVGTEGHGNVVFSGIAASADTVVAVAMRPTSLIPTDFQDLLSGTIFLSTDGGTTFEAASDDFPSNYATSATIKADGTIYVGTLDVGVLERTDDGWVEVGGPTDVVDLEWQDGGLTVASASRGLWRMDGVEWTGTDLGPMAGIDGDLATAYDGTVQRVIEGDGPDAPDDEGGTVHVALSFHVNYYHSYRGDSNDDEGFGQDIRVIRSTLDWLEANPDVKADWDMDNAFSTDDWMVAHSPDILTTIEERVSAGADDVRLMSWNNGAMSFSTREEFDESVARAFDSNEAAFGQVVNGVQPQENMFTPEHIGWYTDAGVDWITLFNAANGFTALREEVALEGYETYNPVTLMDADTGDAMTLVPVYHHADLLDHGGLKGWIRQLSAKYRGTVLLVIHFDADAESWENFDQEITALEGEDNFEWTTIGDYLDGHTPVGTVQISGDLADGTGDGFQSWAEKDFNHEHWTRVVQARRMAEVARFVGDGDTTVEDELAAALEPRLLALSTTNYGLAMPYLHEDRVASATAQADEANELAQTALDTAFGLSSLSAGSLQVINPRTSTGPALVRFTVSVPLADYVDTTGLSILDGTSAQPRIVDEGEVSGSSQQLEVTLVVDVDAESTLDLTWSYDMASPNSAVGTLTVSDAPTRDFLDAPFTKCANTVATGTDAGVGAAAVRDAVWAGTTESFDLDTCDAAGTVERTVAAYSGLPGTVVHVRATLGDASTPDDLQSVVLSPIPCEGGISEVRYQTFGGTRRTRAARQDVETWNGQSADGWAQAMCNDGTDWQISHDTTTRTSPAFLPLSNEGGEALLAPLGSLQGDAPFHESRRDGGFGVGDLAIPVVADTFRPAAPDWSGKEVEYRLLVAEGADEDVLDLFAHPPYVRVGE